jgi:hypothetical protein
VTIAVATTTAMSVRKHLVVLAKLMMPPLYPNMVGPIAVRHQGSHTVEEMVQFLLV